MDARGLIKRWWARTEAVEQAHFRRSVEFQDRHLRWGVLLIVLSSLLGGLGALTQQDELVAPGSTLAAILKVALVALGIVVPMLSAAVTFWRYQERAKAHHDAGARFSALKRLLQCEYVAFQSGREQDLRKELDRVRKAWDQLTLDAPAIDKRDWSEIGMFDDRIDEITRHDASDTASREVRSLTPIAAARA